MSHWHRLTPFSADHGQEWDERWEYSKPGAASRNFNVRVRAGKALDVLKLKGINLDEVHEYSGFLETTAARLYGAYPKSEIKSWMRFVPHSTRPMADSNIGYAKKAWVIESANSDAWPMVSKSEAYLYSPMLRVGQCGRLRYLPATPS